MGSAVRQSTAVESAQLMTRPDSTDPPPPPIDPAFESELKRLAGQLLQFFSSPGRRLAGLEPADLVQMTMVRVYQSMGDFRQESSLRTWVFQVAHNTLKNAVRDTKAQKRAGDEIHLDAAPPGSDDDRRREVADPREDPQEKLLEEERTRELWRAIQGLPTKMGRCLMLSLRDGFTAREIATLLKVKETTVKTHLQTGRKKVKAILRQHFGLSDPEPGGNTG